MRLDRVALRGAGFAFAMLSAAAAHADNSPLGVWIDHTGRGAVEITDCNGKLCGRVAWVKDAANAQECGKQIIGNVASVGKNKWDNGWIYDPDRDSKYDVEVTALDNDKLRVKGYAGTKWLSETYTWKRAPADLQKCSLDSAATAKPAETAKAEPAKPVTEDKSAPVQLNAAKPDADSKADADKSSIAKSDEAPAPEADEQKSQSAAASSDAETNDEPKGGKGKGRVIARLMEELESGDGPVKLKRTGKTCKLDVPYAGVITFPCDKD